jgi:PAS domain S-box-containing protein
MEALAALDADKVHNNILYIEDDAAMRKMFLLLQASLLKPFKFTFAETLDQARIELNLNPKKYSAIVSDYYLPDGEAKNLFPLPVELPVIVLTATYDVTLAVELMKLGVDDFVVKDKNMQFLKLMPEKINSVIEKKMAEVEAALQERRFRDLFVNSNDIIQYLDAEGKIIQANPPLFETLGFDAEEQGQLSVYDLINPHDVPQFKDMLELLEPGQSREDLVLRMRSKSGKEFIMEGSASKGWLGEDLFYTRTIFRDVTEKRRAEIMIKQQNKDLAEKNKQINEGIVKLRNVTVSKKAAAIVLILGIALFFFSEFWLEPTLVKYSGNTNYNWILKIVIVLLLKPFDMLIERWLLRQKIKEAGLA